MSITRHPLIGAWSDEIHSGQVKQGAEKEKPSESDQHSHGIKTSIGLPVRQFDGHRLTTIIIVQAADYGVLIMLPVCLEMPSSDAKKRALHRLAKLAILIIVHGDSAQMKPSFSLFLDLADWLA